jgi:CRISPR system Cascade subunit CasC
MTQFIQFHLLTAYPPANLNRDDTGRPKTAVFGGVERMRISSQSLKRAWRTSAVFEDVLAGRVGKRTQRIGKEVEDHLLSSGVDAAKARSAARAVASVFGKVKSDGDDEANPTFTEQLVFIAPEERARALALAEQFAAGDVAELKADAILVRTDQAADIAMFGRMLADSPSFNRDAAVQVAHAITTHKIVVEDDYYVAVDDLKDSATREDAGTSFIGVQEFGAGLFYTYICVDTDLLVQNLGGDTGLARDAIAALITSAATVAPKGKQTSYASRAYASYIRAEVGTAQPRSLAAAFLKPIDQRSNDPAVSSALKLEQHASKIARVYGESNLTTQVMDMTGDDVTGSLDAIVTFARDAVKAA